MSESGIYRITNLVNGKVYIGQAVNFNNRFWDHKTKLRNKTHKNKHLESAWHLYGEENFGFEILEYVEPDSVLLEQRETFYYYSYPLDQLYNLQIPGQSNLGRKMGPPSEEHRRKVSEGNKGKVRTQEFKDNLSKARMGVPKSEEAKKNMSIAQTGRTLSEEHKQKISQSTKGERNPNYGRVQPEEFIEPLRKVVCQISLETGEVFAVFRSLQEASKVTGFDVSNISKVCRNKLNHIGGWLWRFESDLK